MYTRALLVISLVLMSPTNCKVLAQSNVEELQQIIDSLNHSIPEKDMEINVQKGDVRFMALGEYSFTVVPGLNPKDKSLYLKFYDVRYIKGTESDILDPVTTKLHEAAYKYAKKYNRALAKYLDNDFKKRKQQDKGARKRKE